MIIYNSYVTLITREVKPIPNAMKNHHFPMVFLWVFPFSYGFHMVFRWFSHGIPMVFIWNSYVDDPKITRATAVLIRPGAPHPGALLLRWANHSLGPVVLWTRSRWSIGPWDLEQRHRSIDWFQGKITGKSHISWENLWFPVKIFHSTNPLNRGRSLTQKSLGKYDSNQSSSTLISI